MMKSFGNAASYVVIGGLFVVFIGQLAFMLLAHDQTHKDLVFIDRGIHALLAEHDCVEKTEKTSDCKSEIDQVTAIRGQQP